MPPQAWRRTLFIDLLFVAYTAYRCVYTGVETRFCDNEDHGWLHRDPFEKRVFSTRFLFSNPADAGAELRPYEGLSGAQQLSVRQFCLIRYGDSNMGLCYEKMQRTMRW